MSKAPTARQYAAASYKAERSPQIGILALAGDFYLTDADNNILADKAFKTRAAAEQARSKAREQGLKASYRII